MMCAGRLARKAARVRRANVSVPAILRTGVLFSKDINDQTRERSGMREDWRTRSQVTRSVAPLRDQSLRARADACDEACTGQHRPRACVPENLTSGRFMPSIPPTPLRSGIRLLAG
jgi:hypothetical protein